MDPRHPLPRLWMMTDERQGDQFLSAVERLPSGSGLVFRHYSLDGPDRKRLFDQVAGLARSRSLLLLLAGPPAMAAEWEADGSHGFSGGEKSPPHLLRSVAAHDLDEVKKADEVNADLIFLSPVFATRSHPDAAVLGPDGIRHLARQTSLPVIALGGMNAERFAELSGSGVYGWAAIDALTPGRD